MDERDELIERLSAELGRCYYGGDRDGAARLADQLADVLGNSSPLKMDRYIQSWIQIWEARGDLNEAIRLANIDITRKRSEIEAGDFDPYPQLLQEEIEYLQDNLYMQAGRYDEIGNVGAAIECLRENLLLASRFGREPDPDVVSLLGSLTAE